MHFKCSFRAWMCFCFLQATLNNADTQNATVQAQVQEWDDPLLLVATLDGALRGVGQKTGHTRWKLQEEPIVKVPVESSNSIMPALLPDPRDGSLYVLRGPGQRDTLQKLPFTVPQLVAASPCKSSDGILYTGKKSDTWYAVNPKTGFKEEVISFNNVEKMCPLSDAGTILVGRTEYNILMYDTKMKERKWNVTFYDYSSNSMDSQQLGSYGLVHFAASSTGRTVTLDRHQGSLLWESDFGSPVVALFVAGVDGLTAVPFTSVAEETLRHLRARLTARHAGASDMQLYPTLYVGEHGHGLYALLSLVDEHTPTIAPGSVGGVLLLEGPTPVAPAVHWSHGYSFPVPGHSVRVSPLSLELPVTFHSLPRPRSRQSLVVLGHYDLPELREAHATPQITGRADAVIQPGNSSVQYGVDGWTKLRQVNITFILSRNMLRFIYGESKTWINQQENKGLKLLLVVLCGCSLSMLWYLRLKVREFHDMSRGGHHGVTALAENMGSGRVRVGKITFDAEQVLGKGCEGTFVYKGQFERRAVAVKRLLPECFTVADREVSLLRESDAHANVVRYFCTEQDHQFRYIALELCAATLHDYVEGGFDAGGRIAPREILHQATAGLQHLHSLDIVHRDIKPHNVLLSMPDARGEVRAMISDFGLCKKLKVGRVSFSRRSGATGTDGWIAPEMMVGNAHTTCAVDVFSLGCVIYYVMSRGNHPFGDALHRQANILSGESTLGDLGGGDSELCCHLVSAMIHGDPAQRPPASAVMEHPLFWGEERVLTFLQDVSDRVERDEGSAVLQCLESRASAVVGGDWRYRIDAEVAQDLRKYRSYCGTSIRDLLRALRNKKHHYHELSLEAQRSLGQVPGQFVAYWTSRFPRLVLHSWLAAQCARGESVLGRYYHGQYVFPGAPREPAAGTPALDKTRACRRRSRRSSPEAPPSWKLTPGDS